MDVHVEQYYASDRRSSSEQEIHTTAAVPSAAWLTFFPHTVSLVSPGAERLCKLKPFGLIDQILPTNALGETWTEAVVQFSKQNILKRFALGVSFLREPGFTDFHYPCLYFHLWWSAGPRARFSTDTEWIYWLPEAYHFIWKTHFMRNQFGKCWFTDKASGILSILSRLLKM